MDENKPTNEETPVSPPQSGQCTYVRPAALMLGSDKSRGYCLEMICADFLAGAHVDSGDPKILLSSMLRLFRFLPTAQRQEFLQQVTEAA